MLFSVRQIAKLHRRGATNSNIGRMSKNVRFLALLTSNRMLLKQQQERPLPNQVGEMRGLPEYQNCKHCNVQKEFPQEAVLLVDKTISWQAVDYPSQSIPHHGRSSIQFFSLHMYTGCAIIMLASSRGQTLFLPWENYQACIYVHFTSLWLCDSAVYKALQVLYGLAS